MKCLVQGGQVADLTICVVRGNFGDALVEVYCCDDCFQRQPNGEENGEVVVKLGTVVRWSNVGVNPHTVTGGPWSDSGDMQRLESYIWVANQVGLFPYYCRFARPRMQGTLHVVA